MGRVGGGGQKQICLAKLCTTTHTHTTPAHTHTHTHTHTHHNLVLPIIRMRIGMLRMCHTNLRKRGREEERKRRRDEETKRRRDEETNIKTYVSTSPLFIVLQYMTTMTHVSGTCNVKQLSLVMYLEDAFTGGHDPCQAIAQRLAVHAESGKFECQNLKGCGWNCPPDSELEHAEEPGTSGAEGGRRGRGVSEQTTLRPRRRGRP